jgi:hypothetical protein
MLIGHDKEIWIDVVESDEDGFVRKDLRWNISSSVITN